MSRFRSHTYHSAGGGEVEHAVRDDRPADMPEFDLCGVVRNEANTKIREHQADLDVVDEWALQARSGGDENRKRHRSEKQPRPNSVADIALPKEAGKEDPARKEEYRY